MAYRATPRSTTGFSPNMLVYGRENSMPCDIMYGQTGAVYNRQHSSFCEYVDKLQNNMVASYVRAHQTMGTAAKRQRIYHCNTFHVSLNQVIGSFIRISPDPNRH